MWSLRKFASIRKRFEKLALGLLYIILAKQTGTAAHVDENLHSKGDGILKVKKPICGFVI